MTIGKKLPMMCFKGSAVLFLILVLTLSLVPVLQAAHAFTHYGDAETSGPAKAAGSHVDTDSGDDADSGLDGDRMCLDCLAVAALSIILPVLIVYFFDPAKRRSLPHLGSALVLFNFPTPYLTRAPPPA
ncbi:MAG: hypothetical protein H0X43_00425 [Nitrosospira sp.]|nr:hypothetical protein [Nitrosospira sp.]